MALIFVGAAVVAFSASDSTSNARGFLDEITHAKDSNSSICDNTVVQHSGYFKLTTGKLPKNYFYWFFESRSAPKSDPVVLWMTGGPGCSSEVALFGENGPCSVNAAGDGTIPNAFSWNSNASLLYIDQPAGTGFSYGAGADTDEDGVATDMYDFLQQFMQAHPEYNKLPFFTFGESYAGHYVPAVTHRIWKNNNALPAGAITINLKGTAVGNGLTAPEEQYKWYAEMARSTNHHQSVVNESGYKAMKAVEPACIAAIKACQAAPASCLVATDVCNLGLLIPYQLSGRNVYDMRIPCETPPLCYDFSNVATYLKRADVKAALGTTGHGWSDCNHAVAIGFELDGDWMQHFQQDLPEQLAAGIRVLIYAGDQDYICNWLGNSAWTYALDWPHKAEFNAAPNNTWSVGGTPAGELRQAANFSFLRVYDAGHMVPRDQPERSLAMLNAFISDTL